MTDFLRKKTSDPRAVLALVRTRDGASYLRKQDEYWRVYDLVEDTICLQLPESDKDFYQNAVERKWYLEQARIRDWTKAEFRPATITMKAVS